MRILLLVVYYLPSTMSSAKLIHDLAAEFLRLGHEPTVVAPDETLAAAAESAVEDGIEVLRIRTGRIKTASRLVRAVNEIRLSALIWKRGRPFLEGKRFDLIVYYSPTIFFGALVKKLKKLYGCPAYLVLRDIFPQWALDAGLLKKGLVYRYFKMKERQNYDAADVIGVESPGNLAYFAKNGLAGKYRLEVLNNWTAIEEEIQPLGFRQRLGLAGKVVFFYGGNIGLAQDMDGIVRLAANLKGEKDAYFLLVGDGSEAPRLKAEIAAMGLANIAIHPPLGQKEYLSLVAEFDVGLVFLAQGLKGHNIPGKILGYMRHSLPVLASINPGNDLRNILEENEAGLVCVSGDDEVLAAQARRLLKDEDFRRRLGENARALLVKSFSVTAAARQILGRFD